MDCKFCGRELEPGEKICPDCGGQAESESRAGKLIVMILCSVVLIAVLVVVVLIGIGAIGKETPTATMPPVSLSDSYTVTDDIAQAKASDVVATVGTMQLTNAELQIHYRYQVFNFVNTYAYYLAQFGLDLNRGLDEQICALDQTKTWEEYFLDEAINSWYSYAVLCMMADEENYQLSDEAQKNIDGINDQLKKDAEENGFASVEAMIYSDGGPAATVEGFVSYRTIIFKSMDYFNVKYTAMTPTEDEVAAYFATNAEDYKAKGIDKENGKTVDVRHILIQVKGGTKDEQGNTVYSDDEWAACKAEAERIYQLWKDGEATEDSFATLANTYSEDPGSNTSGGLYSDVPAGQMVPTFNDRIMDMSRQVGDHGLVKTDFGYHIMFYSGDEAIWYATAYDDLLNERFAAFYNGGEEKYPMEVDYEKIVLGELVLIGES